MQFQIDNEYDKLEAVLVHRPGPEIERLTHENMRQFLFEDVPYLRKMQDEHDQFVDVLKGHGVDVVYIESLLLDVLKDESTRKQLVQSVCDTASMPALVDDLTDLKAWDLDQLVQILFSGLTAREFRDATGRRLSVPGDEDHFLLPPIPNAYFSRDPAVIVGNAAISSKMHFRERIRETLLIRAVLEHHSDFKQNAIAYGGTGEPTEDRPYTIEGGDVIVLSPRAVLIGASERTRSETIQLLAAKCFQVGKIERLYEIAIPAERAFMHLDTVFTVLDRGVVLWYTKVMALAKKIHRYEPGEDGSGAVRVPEDRSFIDVLAAEFECDVTVIETAGGQRPFDAREQRADGTNTFAIAPRVAVTYKRNERTNEALEAHGITCLSIDGSELVRGLGGPRCMTMPLRRSPN